MKIVDFKAENPFISIRKIDLKCFYSNTTNNKEKVFQQTYTWKSWCRRLQINRMDSFNNFAALYGDHLPASCVQESCVLYDSFLWLLDVQFLLFWHENHQLCPSPLNIRQWRQCILKIPNRSYHHLSFPT